MERINHINCLRTVPPLLCLFIFGFLGCSSLKKLNSESIVTSQPILQVAIGGNEFSLFMKRIQELNLIPVDIKQRIPNSENIDINEFYVTFRFVTQNDFTTGRSEIMSTGVARIISYK